MPPSIYKKKSVCDHRDDDDNLSPEEGWLNPEVEVGKEKLKRFCCHETEKSFKRRTDNFEATQKDILREFLEFIITNCQNMVLVSHHGSGKLDQVVYKYSLIFIVMVSNNVYLDAR